MQLVVPVVQVKGNLIKSGHFGPEKYIIATLYYCDLDLSRPCWAQNLLESKFDCTGFFRSGDKMLLLPFSGCGHLYATLAGDPASTDKAHETGVLFKV